MNKTWFIADLHFGHKNIINLENRPFENVGEMDNILIFKWNSAVKKDDKVFILGDYSFYDKNKTSEITNKLNGNKTLIKGNHDNHSEKWYLDCGFKSVYSYPIIYKDWFVLSHEPPTYFNNNMPYAFFYGHTHSCNLYPTFTKNTCCVCSERHNYAPILFENIVEIMKNMNESG